MSKQLEHIVPPASTPKPGIHRVHILAFAEQFAQLGITVEQVTQVLFEAPLLLSQATHMLISTVQFRQFGSTQLTQFPAE